MVANYARSKASSLAEANRAIEALQATIDGLTKQIEWFQTTITRLNSAEDVYQEMIQKYPALKEKINGE